MRMIHIKRPSLCARCTYRAFGTICREEPCDCCPMLLDEPQDSILPGIETVCYCDTIRNGEACERFKEDRV